LRYNFLPSFARRKGRITKLQEKNLSFLADYSLDDPNTLNNNSSFDKIALEIGFGNGEDFFSFAKEKNNTLFLASEVYKSGIGNLIGKIREHSLENIYIHEGDIRDLIFEEKGFKFDEVYIICPDPWPKDRHHKRRLLNKDFFERIQPCLKPNSFIFLSTDWKNYSEKIKDVLRGFEDKFSIETVNKYLGEGFLSFKKKESKKDERYITFN
jgi:Predicted S-adenosylmethionine-dependent methyltransferase